MAKLLHGDVDTSDTTTRLVQTNDDNQQQQIGETKAANVSDKMTNGCEMIDLIEKTGASTSISNTNNIIVSPDYERKAYVIGICGGSASGKTTVARNIIQDLHIMGPPKACVLISMDSFYRDFNQQEREQAFRHEFNFDTPGAFDFALLKELLRKMKDKQSVEVPQYSFVKHAREKGVVTHVEPAEIVLFEGILAFHDPEVAALCDLKIFVDIDPDIRLARRLQRDIVERGRDLAGALKQYERSVKPSFDQFIAPTKSMADIIVPRGGENHIAIDIIIGHLVGRLQETPFSMIAPPMTTKPAMTDGTSPSSPLVRTVSAHPVLRTSKSNKIDADEKSASPISACNTTKQQQELKRVADYYNSHQQHSNGEDRKSDQIKELSNGNHQKVAAATNGYHRSTYNTNHHCAIDRSSSRSPTSSLLIKKTKFTNGAAQHSSTTSSSSSAAFVHELVAVDSV